jgi:hypothetical protein
MARKGVQATLSLSDPSGAGLIYLTLHHDETIEDTTENMLKDKSHDCCDAESEEDRAV